MTYTPPPQINWIVLSTVQLRMTALSDIWNLPEAKTPPPLLEATQPMMLPPDIENWPGSPFRSESIHTPPPHSAEQPIILPPLMVRLPPFLISAPPPQYHVVPPYVERSVPVPPVMTPPVTVSVPLASSSTHSLPFGMNLCERLLVLLSSIVSCPRSRPQSRCHCLRSRI